MGYLEWRNRKVYYMKLNKAMFTASAIALLTMGGAITANADTPKSSHDVALEVIEGHYGNGDERVTSLEALGLNPDQVQAEVNNILTGSDTVNTEQPKQSPEVNTAQTTQSVQAPEVNTNKTTQTEQSVGGINLSQTTGSVDINALANYMVSNTANASGYSASQWATIITLESRGGLTATNPTSGAYGVFQLLGHGEYQGMTLGQQIDMASHLPAGSWVVI